jgi:septum site-determining protein MinD
MLAVAGGKGGCGKTTTTVGLATVLAKAGREPLVVDADTDMPNLHHVAGLAHTGGIDSVAAGKQVCQAVRVTDTFPGVRFLTAGERDSLPPALRRAYYWRGPVLVDCQTGIDRRATRPLATADRTLLVSTDRPECRQDTRKTAIAARNLGSDPCGALVRETPVGTVPESVGHSPVIETVPTLEMVRFDDARLIKRWQTVTGRLF